MVVELYPPLNLSIGLLITLTHHVFFFINHVFHSFVT